MKSPIAPIYASALALTLGLATPLSAQNAPTEEKTVQLSPFTVNVEHDNGYIAVDSLSGGRMDAPIRVTPAPISSLTSAFVNDLALTNVNDVLKWSLNTVPTSDRSGLTGGSGGGVFNYWSISTRGDHHDQGGNPPTKNYFPMFTALDTYNIDRVEFDQGPNSILFGIGDIGGAVSVYTKTARFDRNFSNVNLMYDSYGGYRGTIDVNQSQGDLALRVNAVGANEHGWRDGDYHHKLGADLAADWKFSNGNGHLRLEIEGWKEKKAIFGSTYQDDFSLWNGSTNAATWGATIAHLSDNPQTVSGAPGVTGMSDWGLNPYNVLVAGSGKVVNWAGGVRSMGTNNIGWGAYMRPSAFNYSPTGGTLVAALPSREFTVSPSDGYLKPEAMNVTLTYDQRLNQHMDLEIAGYRYVDNQYSINYEGASTASRDLNKQLPDGTTNPEYGQLYSDYFLDKQIQDHWVNEVRGQLSYHFDANPFEIPLKQLFSVSAGQQVTEYDARQLNGDWIANDPSQTNWTADNWTRDMVWGRMYWDHPQAALNVPAGVIYRAMPFNWYDFNSKQTIKYGGAFSQTRLWDDRLNITLGARRDTYNVSKIGLRGGANTPVVGSGAGNTYSVGAIGYITEWLGVFGNISDNYQPAAGGLAPSLFGEVRGASFGKGKNAGIRLSTKDGKYYASVTWYKDTATDVIGGDSADFQTIWNDYLAAGGTASDIGPAGQIHGVTAQMQYTTIYDVEYKGTEFELTANPTKNIRLQLHYAAPKGERNNDGIDGRNYFQGHLATWQAVASGSSTAAQKLASDLATAQHNYAIWAVPTLAGGVVKSQWNAFATYSFTEDALKGLDIGFGATETGARQIDQVNRTTAFTTESLLVGYTKDFDEGGHKVRARLQLNVDNLFGNKTLVFQSYNGTQAMDYNFIPSRKFTFTVRFDF
jgi:outer membrane receptor protein involved in Fe transport